MADTDGSVHITSSPDCAKVLARMKVSETERQSLDVEMTKEGTYFQILRSTALFRLKTSPCLAAGDPVTSSSSSCSMDSSKVSLTSLRHSPVTCLSSLCHCLHGQCGQKSSSLLEMFFADNVSIIIVCKATS